MDGMLPQTHAPFISEPRHEGQMQHTIRQPISSVGTGLHTGARISLRLSPAPENTGIVFRRTDIDMPPVVARYDMVVDTCLSTVLGCDTTGGHAERIATIEHLMAGLAGCGVDNIFIDVDGPEIPVFDGSAAEFVFLLECAGIVPQAAPRQHIHINRTVRVEDGDAYAELSPTAQPGLTIDISIDFPAAAIGQQRYMTGVEPGQFREHLSRARTFVLQPEIDYLHSVGLARGGSLDNAVVVNGDSVVNPSGLRHPDEFVRHKVLDAIGDLYLAGGMVNGHFRGHKSGHTLNNRLLRKVFAEQANWRRAPLDASLPAPRDRAA
ncbi:UDP-3-O-acyl-N-acetylglucosamine deacetylase [Komagataeibacter intermedius]|mgnify:CR=1 FL=1|uniref:UDP-3-O-acyl-N-acetylglucosamine deacetylase n=2 Tax=Komagataeibacter intermedius TaxID=66229 RepID=A0A0N1F8T9_9PROT|nr:UDP-3-O-acyl-N-acetylglucosamine deacetylase [Komagataeibacter intermedius]KPH85322.1 UDP-3-O-(3-hydroxymyristoyl) glucosamine N-acyltransferase [Komagataeibacter intermedius AF2]MCF3637947.1 UDP-3-O-acyl-N-acetylglucosamine deacetylase [Komagataeibacter intermedius]GAN88387.1 UDP-3-O-[3-hydroxymyristoyl] N-acetylglucosamine deacetylase [Komagataeibacter intermedius TF2]GBQ67429.1 UDP-3-O-[3-hydroxymyristoyl] N-acetylglucosamine deacetylase [Komagataeibacter intermedius NRIC 0521]